MKVHTTAQRQRGFTIVELLVATLVFSVVLLVVTIGILQVTRVYYQGVTEANTQNTARSIIDTISQAIQFNGAAVVPTPVSPVPGTQAYFCVGSTQFIYYPGYQLTDGVVGAHQTSHGLVEQPFSGSCAAPAIVNGRELLGPHMRLSNIVVKSVGTNLYQVEVRIVYGDKDLLQSKSAPANPNGDTFIDAQCSGKQAGSQFCAVADLTTVVVKRVQ